MNPLVTRPTWWNRDGSDDTTQPLFLMAAPKDQQPVDRLWIAGRFRVSGRNNVDHFPHRRLSILTSFSFGRMHHIGIPFADHALFAEDVVKQQDDISGFFQIEITSWSAMDYQNIYHVTAMLDELTSRPLRLDLRLSR